MFDEWVAQHFDALWPELIDPAVVNPAVDFLADLAGRGPALELGVGTGRIAIPLSRRGIPVHGIDLSPAMLARLGDSDVEVTVGDFATTTVDGAFTLVYLLRNTITNLTTQDEQVSSFRNAAAHLAPGGCFLIENYVPALRDRVFTATPTHVGVEEYDLGAQIAVSHHYWLIDDQMKALSSPHRYVWPSELDLMALLAGLTLRERWATWQRDPFTGESPSHISVWERHG